jgi:hypothetical protein
MKEKPLKKAFSSHSFFRLLIADFFVAWNRWFFLEEKGGLTATLMMKERKKRRKTEVVLLTSTKSNIEGNKGGSVV